MTRFLSLHTLLTYSYLPVVPWVVGGCDVTVGVIEEAVDNTEVSFNVNEVVGVDDDETAGLVEVTVAICFTADVDFTNKEQIAKHSVKFVKS